VGARLCTVAPMPERRWPSSVPSRQLKLVAVAAVALGIPTVAMGAQVRGKLNGLEKLMNPVWAETKDVSSHRFSWREPSPTVRAEFRSLFAHAPKEVCVAAVGAVAQQPPALPLLITVGGGRTTPVTVVVAPGTRLHFENRDPFAHRLYGVGQSTFPAGDMVAMAARDWTAPGPGKYEIRDELSPSVRSWVVVEPNVAAISYPSSAGMFLIPQLAPGEYTLRAYFNGAPVGTPRSFVLGGMNVDMAISVAEGADRSRPDGGEKE
jgi:hypothetical protein